MNSIEIKRVKPLFEGVNIEGTVVTADALLTRKDLADYWVKKFQSDGGKRNKK